jgi:replication factor A1
LVSFRWTIKARITSKSDIRRWSNAKGEGTLFSIDLLDSDGGEIRATFFKEACDKWFPVLEEGKVSHNSCRLACIPSDFN